MTTLVSDIIRDAYRESNLIAIGTEPSGAQQEEGLRLLVRILESVYGTKEGEELIDLPIGRNGIDKPSGFPYYSVTPAIPDFFVPPNARLVLNIVAPLTLYLNPTPQDGERFAVLDKSEDLNLYPLTLQANGRTIGGDDNLIINTSGASLEYMYRADLGDWTLVSPISATDIWPFPGKFDDMFVIMLAMRLNPRNDVDLDPQSVAMMKTVVTQFQAKYRQKRAVRSELGLLKTSTRRERYDDYDGTDLFNSGYPFNNWRY